MENDAVRARLAAALGLDGPTHEPEENLRTYQTAWRLLTLGLDGGAHVVHDATSLTEAGRRGAYEVADARWVDANLRRPECDPHFAAFFTRTVS